nr:CotH kinase family protein [Ligilactobacillus equi]
MNGNDQGLYVLTTYHQDKLYNMDDKNQEQIIITGENYTDAPELRKNAVLSDFPNNLEAISPADVTQKTVDAFNELVALANATDGDEYHRLETQYLDTEAAVDYITFSLVINNIDGFAKNIHYLKDGNTKWVLMTYDLDVSWDNSWNGETLSLKEKTWVTMSNNNKLLSTIYHYHEPEIKKRYLELRKSVFSDENITTLINKWVETIGLPNYQNNDRLWKNISNTTHRLSKGVVENYNKVIESRLEYMDSIMK